jgi:hypothetical protein
MVAGTIETEAGIVAVNTEAGWRALFMDLR